MKVIFLARVPDGPDEVLITGGLVTPHGTCKAVEILVPAWVGAEPVEPQSRDVVDGALSVGLGAQSGWPGLVAATGGCMVIGFAIYAAYAAAFSISTVMQGMRVCGAGSTAPWQRCLPSQALP